MTQPEPEAPETENDDSEKIDTGDTEDAEPEHAEPEHAEPEDTEQLEHAEGLIDEARSAAREALPDTESDDDLDAPSTGEGLPEDEPVTPGPN